MNFIILFVLFLFRLFNKAVLHAPKNYEISHLVLQVNTVSFFYK